MGWTPVGPSDRPGSVTSLAEYETTYGPSSAGPLGDAIRLYFANGGREAVVCRLAGDGDASAGITDADVSDPQLEQRQAGLWLLEEGDAFEILCIPPLAPGRDVAPPTWAAAAAYAHRRRAFLLVDAPASWVDPAAIGISQLEALIEGDEERGNAAVYFPSLRCADPPDGGTQRAVAPCGAIAGVYARMDAKRGTWNAPAGLEATITDVAGLTMELNDDQNGMLNPLGVNCLRTFPGQPAVIWGARTMRGQDGAPADWKYVSVRRLTLYLERSIEQGTRWALFEPNAEHLWDRLRADVGDFMQTLFRAGAFAGRTPDEAYFVKCDRGTMTQADIERGDVIIDVGFAPQRPAEFVVFRIRHSGADSDG